MVDSYINTGEPVGSKSLIAQTGLDVSSATVRNDMADLTNRGYLVQPHTSAGRIPTHLGYRYYIDNSMTVTPVSEQGREYISNKLYESADSPESILNGATKLLSELTDCAAVATTPCSDNSRVHRINFVQIGSHTAMAVLIVSNGIIQTKLFRCSYIVTPEILSIFNQAMNEIFVGIRLSSINRPFLQTAAAKYGELSLLIPDVLIAIFDAAEKACQVSICKSGLTKLLFMSDTDFYSVKKLMEYLGNDHDLAAMLDKVPIDTAVFIGKENSRVELSESALISSRYMVDNNPSGVLAIIGSVRMNYSRSIAVLNCISECAGNLINELITI